MSWRASRSAVRLASVAVSVNSQRGMPKRRVELLADPDRVLGRQHRRDPARELLGHRRRDGRRPVARASRPCRRGTGRRTRGRRRRRSARRRPPREDREAAGPAASSTASARRRAGSRARVRRARASAAARPRTLHLSAPAARQAGRGPRASRDPARIPAWQSPPSAGVVSRSRAAGEGSRAGVMRPRFWVIVLVLLAINYSASRCSRPARSSSVRIPYSPEFLQQVDAEQRRGDLATGATRRRASSRSQITYPPGTRTPSRRATSTPRSRRSPTPTSSPRRCRSTTSTIEAEPINPGRGDAR